MSLRAKINDDLKTAMKAGDTFFLAGGAADRHLRVIISDPAIDPERVLFVSMTSYYPGTKETHVGRAFQPDFLAVSGWKARPTFLPE